MNELAKRIGTAAILLLVVVGALALNEIGIGPAPWMLFVAVACGVAVWEWARLLGLGRMGQIAYLAASALLVSALMSPALENAVWLAFGLWIIAILRIAGIPFPRTVETLFFGMLGWATVPVAGLILVAFLGPFVWAFLVVVIVADTAAYFVGHRYGKTALAPEISPGKTRAGLVGALLAVAVVSIPIAWGLDLPLTAWFYFACLALLVACFSVVGDLSVSLLKRRADVKDSGRFLPGHGGALDRVDGLLAAAPVYALGIQALQGVLLI